MVTESVKDRRVNVTELAQVLGITARRVQQLTQDGTLVTVEKGKFELGDAVKRYIAFISAKDKTPTVMEEEKLKAEVSWKKSKAAIALLESNELRGTMHRSEDVAKMTEDLIYTIRSMLIALPGRLAVDAQNAKSTAEAADIIKKEIYKVMQELAKYRYDPNKYQELVRERKDWSLPEDEERKDRSLPEDEERKDRSLPEDEE